SGGGVVTKMAQRMLTDVGWMGNGAGSFDALTSVYRETAALDAITAAPTAAARIIIELGPAAFWILACAAVGLAAVLLRGALQRGRDYFYPALGAAVIVTMLIQSFCDASFFST